MKDKMVHGHRWTDEELKRFIGEWLSGKETSEIAAAFGVSIAACNKIALRIRKEGIALPYKKRGHVAGRTNMAWKQEEVEYVIRRRAEGATNDEIASELDRTIYSILGILQKLREDGVSYQRNGGGRKRLWNSEKLRMAIAGKRLITEKLTI